MTARRWAVNDVISRPGGPPLGWLAGWLVAGYIYKHCLAWFLVVARHWLVGEARMLCHDGVPSLTSVVVVVPTRQDVAQQ